MTDEALRLPVFVELGLQPVSEILQTPSADGALGFRHETSDGLALHLQARASLWRLRVCQYDMVTPTRMRVC